MKYSYTVNDGIVLQQVPQYLQDTVANIIGALPAIVAAVVILVIGLVVGRVLGGVVEQCLDLGVEVRLERLVVLVGACLHDLLQDHADLEQACELVVRGHRLADAHGCHPRKARSKIDASMSCMRNVENRRQ